MGETLSALDTASTEDLVRALMARLRGRLAMAAGPLERGEEVRAVAGALAREGLLRHVEAIDATVEAFLAEHPATAPPPMPEFPFPFGLPFGPPLMTEGGLPLTGMRIIRMGGGGGGEAGDPASFLRQMVEQAQAAAQAQVQERPAGKKGRKKGRRKRG